MSHRYRLCKKAPSLAACPILEEPASGVCVGLGVAVAVAGTGVGVFVGLGVAVAVAGIGVGVFVGLGVAVAVAGTGVGTAAVLNRKTFSETASSPVVSSSMTPSLDVRFRVSSSPEPGMNPTAPSRESGGKGPSEIVTAPIAA